MKKRLTLKELANKNEITYQRVYFLGHKLKRFKVYWDGIWRADEDALSGDNIKPVGRPKKLDPTKILKKPSKKVKNNAFIS